MSVDNQLIDELRTQFKRGATPARLIRHIIKRLGQHADHWTIRDCLMKAFCLPVVRKLKPNDVYPRDADLRYAFLNKLMIPDIIHERQHWDRAKETKGESAKCWLDGLPSASSEMAKESVRMARCPGLSEESWAKLTSVEQESLRVLMASSQVLSERVEILSKLAEQLQEQVEELE